MPPVEILIHHMEWLNYGLLHLSLKFQISCDL